MKKKKGVLFILVFAALAAAVFAAAELVKRMPSLKKADFFAYYGLEPSRAYIILDGRAVKDGEPPLFRGGELYLPSDFIKEYFDEYIFAEPDYNLLTVTTAGSVRKFSAGGPEGVINENGVMYVPESLAESLYPLRARYAGGAGAGGLVVADTLTEPQNRAVIMRKQVNLRAEPSEKSPIIQKLSQNEEVRVYSSGKYLRIRTEQGILGYVTAASAEARPGEPPVKPVSDAVPFKALDGKAVMLWDQVTTAAANSAPDRKVKPAPVNVLSPTWFSFAESMDGGITSLADRGYVENAHSQSALVWALVSDNFDSAVGREILTDPAKRGKAVDALLNLCAEYGLDGINIDFEQIKEDTAPAYIEFLRELAPPLHKAGKSLSVDMFVPKFTKYYNRAAVGETADFICVMAYDEFWGPASGAGPVASAPFVREGVEQTLEEVPAEKVILGIPFYSRLWRELPDGTVEVAGAYGMETAAAIPAKNGARTFYYDDEGTNYAEYVKNENGRDATYKIWIEDERTLAVKLGVYKENGLAGVSFWKRGLEDPEVWALIGREAGRQ
ncbi:MAG: SH3 domain-containing protein [Clostridiales bacterium]|jgi:spore germination protein YaaH/uncharacterized protein YgiM (DUF1202 family)|nr:SH3 domain-containing protein [Clostridiales bacterium]